MPPASAKRPKPDSPPPPTPSLFEMRGRARPEAHPAASQTPAPARIPCTPTLENGVLTVMLPEVVDGLNARVIRKLIVRCLPDANSLVLDCDRLSRIGPVGCAMLWQVMTIAQAHGTTVTLINVAQSVHDVLDRIARSDSRRSVATSPAVELHESESELRISGKTLRLRDTGRIERAPNEQPRAQKSPRWTERLMLSLLPGRRRTAA